MLFLTCVKGVDAVELGASCYNMKHFGNSNKKRSYFTYRQKNTIKIPYTLLKIINKFYTGPLEQGLLQIIINLRFFNISLVLLLKHSSDLVHFVFSMCLNSHYSFQGKDTLVSLIFVLVCHF